MTVKITKPELNLREKISELDYSKVPYEKMPAGSVVQTQFTILTGSGTANEAETTSSTYQQTNHTVTISPKFKNSIIRIDMAPNTKQNSGTAYQTLAIYKNIAGGGWEFGTTFAFGSTVSTAPHGAGTIRHNGTATTWNIHPILFFDRPGTTETIEYRLFQRNSSNGAFTVRVGENGADEFCSATEIKQ
jgi:hypothetical protein|tara:strand:- start:706 stop:1272 length:567 start_codon:yes stop_codon:yes gene_type:complete